MWPSEHRFPPAAPPPPEPPAEPAADDAPAAVTSSPPADPSSITEEPPRPEASSTLHHAPLGSAVDVCARPLPSEATVSDAGPNVSPAPKQAEGAQTRGQPLKPTDKALKKTKQSLLPSFSKPTSDTSRHHTGGGHLVAKVPSEARDPTALLLILWSRLNTSAFP